jgi:hypothetical protein
LIRWLIRDGLQRLAENRKAQLAIEDQDLYLALDAGIVARAGGAAPTQTGGLHHKHLTDVIREALTARLTP